MSRLPIPTIHPTGVYDLQKIQEYVQVAFRNLVRAVRFLDGQMLDSEATSLGTKLDGITFTAATARDLDHKLGRKPAGFIVVDNFGTNGANLLRDEPNSNALTIRLTSTTTCKVKLWVY